jgi:CRISPR-associated protein Csd2
MSTSLTNKIDFAVVISAEHANPNGDPLNGNRPRQTYDGFGEISDVCLKRKIRNRLQDMGEQIFVQSDDRRSDDYRSLKDRYDAVSKKDDNWEPRRDACATWFDVRAFGQVFAFKKKNKKAKKEEAESTEVNEAENSVSIGIRGPVTVQSAYSLKRIIVDSLQITKSVNLETPKNDPDARDSDTMGMKHRIGKGVYAAYGSISTNLAARTGFSDEDAQKVKLALRSLFENDASSARPEGSMKVVKVVWWQHNLPSGQYSSAKVHQALKDALSADGAIDEQKVIAATPGLKPEFLDQLEGAELAASLKR